MIPKAAGRVERVLLALNISVVRRRGRRMWSLCPFHEDHDASNFFVRVDGERAGNYHCFACKVGGSLANLVMHVRGCDYDTARAFIATLGKGWEAPRASVRVVARPPLLGRRAFALPREVEVEPLAKWVTGAERYARSRRITDEEVERYGLGYAVDGRLAGRIVFPVRYPGGRAAGYSARTFADDERKYLTPHESEAADLDAVFGQHLWPAPGERSAIVVCEGAINAMACARASGLPVAACSGSDVRPGHVLHFSTFEDVVLFTDGDEAGDRAARGFRSSLGRHTRLARARLAGGEDPADLQPDDLKMIIERALKRAS